MDLTTAATSVAALLVYAGARRLAQANRARNIALNIAQHPERNFEDGRIQYNTMDIDPNPGLVNQFLFGPERISRQLFGPYGPGVERLRHEDGLMIGKNFSKLIQTNPSLSENVDSYHEYKQREYDADPTGIIAARRQADREIKMEKHEKEMNNVRREREFQENGNISINNSLIQLCMSQINYNPHNYDKEPKFEVEDFRIQWHQGQAWHPNIYIRNAADNIRKYYQTEMSTITLVKITWFKKGGIFPVYYDVGQQPVRDKIYHPWEVPGGSRETYKWQMFPQTVLNKNTIIDLGDGKTTANNPVIHRDRGFTTLNTGHCWISVEDFDKISSLTNERPKAPAPAQRRKFGGTPLDADWTTSNGPTQSFMNFNYAMAGHGDRASPHYFATDSEATRRKFRESERQGEKIARDRAFLNRTGARPGAELIQAYDDVRTHRGD